MSQRTMFEQAPSQASDTSKAAARAIEPHMNRLQRIVLTAIERSGELGMTDREVQDATGMRGSTQRPRRIELLSAGKLKDSGIKRNRSTVWITEGSSSTTSQVEGVPAPASKRRSGGAST